MDDRVLRYQGIELSPERLESAAQIYAGLRPGILRLREVGLSFTDPVWEPGHALRWIESGGEAGHDAAEPERD
jgi:hypothetical protein